MFSKSHPKSRDCHEVVHQHRASLTAWLQHWKAEHDKKLLYGVMKHGWGEWQTIYSDKLLELEAVLRLELDLPPTSLKQPQLAQSQLPFISQAQPPAPPPQLPQLQAPQTQSLHLPLQSGQPQAMQAQLPQAQLPQTQLPQTQLPHAQLPEAQVQLPHSNPPLQQQAEPGLAQDNAHLPVPESTKPAEEIKAEGKPQAADDKAEVYSEPQAARTKDETSFDPQAADPSVKVDGAVGEALDAVATDPRSGGAIKGEAEVVDVAMADAPELHLELSDCAEPPHTDASTQDKLKANVQATQQHPAADLGSGAVDPPQQQQQQQASGAAAAVTMDGSIVQKLEMPNSQQVAVRVSILPQANDAVQVRLEVTPESELAQADVSMTDAGTAGRESIAQGTASALDQAVKGDPHVKGDPQSLKGDPQSLKGDPQSVKGEPQPAKGDHQAVKGDPQAVKGDPQSMKGDSQSVKGDPQSLKGDPQSVKGEPQPAKGDPQPVKGEPQSVEGDPQVKAAKAFTPSLGCPKCRYARLGCAQCRERLKHVTSPEEATRVVAEAAIAGRMTAWLLKRMSALCAALKQRHQLHDPPQQQPQQAQQAQQALHVKQPVTILPKPSSAPTGQLSAPVNLMRFPSFGHTAPVQTGGAPAAGSNQVLPQGSAAVRTPLTQQAQQPWQQTAVQMSHFRQQQRMLQQQQALTAAQQQQQNRLLLQQQQRQQGAAMLQQQHQAAQHYQQQQLQQQRLLAQQQLQSRGQAGAQPALIPGFATAAQHGYYRQQQPQVQNHLLHAALTGTQGESDAQCQQLVFTCVSPA